MIKHVTFTGKGIEGFIRQRLVDHKFEGDHKVEVSVKGDSPMLISLEVEFDNSNKDIIGELTKDVNYRKVDRMRAADFLSERMVKFLYGTNRSEQVYLSRGSNGGIRARFNLSTIVTSLVEIDTKYKYIDYDIEEIRKDDDDIVQVDVSIRLDDSQKE